MKVLIIDIEGDLPYNGGTFREGPMVQILGGQLLHEDVTGRAMGGTELIASEMVRRLDPELLKRFQIVHSRVRALDSEKKRVFVAHDLPGDPESEFLRNGGYNRFDRLVFVSNWQMQQYIAYYDIPWYKCVVIKNAIVPVDVAERPTDVVRLIYHTTPHRGLDILANAFANIASRRNDVSLDVYSSFAIYGWEERDREFSDLFDFLRDHEKVTYHGSVPNEEVRRAVARSHVFAYPSTWAETSCICLMEAMSAGLVCVHSNLAALPETASSFTMMYQYQDNKRDHTALFEANLEQAIELVKERDMVAPVLTFQKTYADAFYNWDQRAVEWDRFLRSLL